MPEVNEVTEVSADDAALVSLKAQHGKVVVLRIEGKLLVFRRLTRNMVTEMKTQIGKKPELAVEISINQCEFCCVYGKQHFAELARLSPLVFCGNDESPGVIDALMDLARGGGTASIRAE